MIDSLVIWVLRPPTLPIVPRLSLDLFNNWLGSMDLESDWMVDGRWGTGGGREREKKPSINFFSCGKFKNPGFTTKEKLYLYVRSTTT